MTELAPSTHQSPVKATQDFPVVEAAINHAVKDLDFKSNHLVSIIKNKNRVIRKLPKGDFTNAYLLGEIRKIATAYGGDKDLPAVVQKECVRALLSSFASMSISEVWIAFRLHSSGELPDVKGRGENYGGKMTAKSFNAVLGAWKKYKAEAVANYIDKIHKDEQEKEEAIRAERMKKNFWPQLIATLKKLIENPDTDWRDCPTYMFDVLRNRNLIPGLDDKEVWKPIWKDAQQLAAMDFHEEKNDSIRQKEIRLIGSIAQIKREESIETKSKAIAKKLALYRLVILNKSFNLESLLNLKPDLELSEKS